MGNQGRGVLSWLLLCVWKKKGLVMSSQKKSPQVTTTLMRIVVAPYMHTPTQRRLIKWSLIGLVVTIACNCLLPPLLLDDWFPPYHKIAIAFTIAVTLTDIVLMLCVHFSLHKKEVPPWSSPLWESITGPLQDTTTEYVPVARIPTTEEYPPLPSSLPQERPLTFSRTIREGMTE